MSVSDTARRLHAAGRASEAAAAYSRALAAAPNDGTLYRDMGILLLESGLLDKATHAFVAAARLCPDDADSYYNLGNALRLRHDLDRAAQCYGKAISIDPGHADAWHNRALVHQEQGRHDDAMLGFRMASDMRPDHHGMRFALARSMQRNGAYEESWPHFASGLYAGLRKPRRRFRQPRWGGEDISGKRILLWREQGIGDELHMARRYADVVAAAAHTVIEADPRLVSLFQRSFPTATVLPERLDAVADMERTDFDVHVPAGNLLERFPLTDEELALAQYPGFDTAAAFECRRRSRGAERYLIPDPDRVSEMAERVAALPEGLKVGICWRSGLSHRDRDVHYTRLEYWAPIFKVPGITWINLFYDECEAEIVAAEKEHGIRIHRCPDLDLRQDMESAFALTAQCDLVVSTSTSPIRIAQALGKETWLLSAGANRPGAAPDGEHGVPNQICWRRHWDEPWDAVMRRVARAMMTRVIEEGT